MGTILAVFDPKDVGGAPIGSEQVRAVVGVEEGGVYRSPDRGRSFEPLDRGVYSDIHCVASDPSDPKKLFVTTGRGFYLSTARSDQMIGSRKINDLAKPMTPQNPSKIAYSWRV